MVRRIRYVGIVMVLAAVIGCSQEQAPVPEAYEIASRDVEAVTLGMDSIRARDTLRVLTRNNATTYFLHRGAEMGFEYEMVKKFAEEELGVHVKMIVPPHWDDMIPWLRQGKGDLIAASMTVTGERAERVRFARPYNTVYQVILNRVEDDTVSSPADLIGKRIHVRTGSSYYTRLRALNDSLGGGIDIVAVPEEYETEYVIRLLMDKVIDMTVADVTIARMEQSQYDSLRINCRITEDEQIAWAVRPDADSLAERVNAFVDRVYINERGHSAFYNILYRRYFRHTRRYNSFRRSVARLRTEGSISPYDDLIRQHAQAHGFGFSLIAAQVYQESRFNPEAQSWVGAQGLMQLMPRTAEALGVEDASNPSENVEAGVRYLRRMYDRFDGESLEAYDRLAFALASYNVGYSHVRDARALAEEEQRSGQHWADNVEWMLLNLSRREYYSRARAGYARGHEGVNYVNQILDRAATYKRHLTQVESMKNTPELANAR